MVEEYDYLFKSIVVGDGGVGKTALTLRFSKGFFTEDYKMTIGVDFHVKTIAIETVEGLIKCKLQLWDTGGQERFSSIRPMYYRGSLGTVLVFDLTNSASFEHLPQWIEEVRSNIKADIPILLVGNKSDLVDQRAVSIEEISNFTRDFNLYYMETSAKTGDGVGDCFYILACLMIGQSIPEQFIANATVFTPGDIPSPSPSETPSEPTDAYLAPPVPEPIQSFEPEPEIEFEAPPVPEPIQSFEPAPEIEYEAPPVPEPVPTFEPQPEPEISMPEPTEIKFITPDEILLQKAEKSEPKILPSILPESSTVESEVYKPQTIPFSSNIPVPATPPKEFQTEKSEVVSSTQTPFRVMKREEPPKPQPASMTFEPTPEPKAEPTSVTPLFQTTLTQPSSAESLIDYMPQTILSKKEMKKLAKEKKKQEKEKKTLEAREKQEKLLEDMKKLKKEKKEKKEKQIEHKTSKSISPTPPLDTTPEASSLFQTLTQKFEENSIGQSTPFIPFNATKKSEEEEKSKLRIIPNVADIESEPSKFTAITSAQTVQEEPRSKDLLVCKQCGAILSSDYTFCNKCGSKL
jgi:Ras-related protein Rab-11A